MLNDRYIEIIYISSTNIIKKIEIEYRDNLYLEDVISFMVKNSIFTKKFLSTKFFGCFGKKIESNYIVRKNDRIEIFDNLKMTPNEKRKFNFKKN
tara:strand:+ start:193 stop:477 length:285 start_codon:yes stop_codon:yes gene_type:complete